QKEFDEGFGKFGLSTTLQCSDTRRNHDDRAPVAKHQTVIATRQGKEINTEADFEVTFFHPFQYSETAGRNGVELAGKFQHPCPASLPTAVLQNGFDQRMHGAGSHGVGHGNALSIFGMQQVIPVLWHWELSGSRTSRFPGPAYCRPGKVDVRAVAKIDYTTTVFQNDKRLWRRRPEKVELPVVAGKHFVQRSVGVLVEHPNFDRGVLLLEGFHHRSNDVILVRSEDA